MLREDFLNNLMGENVPSNEWQTRMDEYRNIYGRFEDDEIKPTAYSGLTPAQVFAQKNELNAKELQGMEKTATLSGLRDLLIGSEVQESLSEALSDTIARDDMDLSDTDEIDDETYLNQRQKEYDEVPNVMFPLEQYQYDFQQSGINTPTRVQESGFESTQQSFEFAKGLQAVGKGFQFVGSSGRKITTTDRFRSDVYGDRVGRRDITGEIIEGSMSTPDRFRMGSTLVEDNQITASLFREAVITGNRQDLIEHIGNVNNLYNAIGDSALSEGKNAMARIWDDTAGTLAPVVESAALSYIPYAGSALATTYWAEQGMGSILYAIYGDKDLSSVSDEDLQKSVAIAQAIAIPYAFVEKFAQSIPWAKRNGRLFSTRLANAMMKKALTDPNFIRTSKRLGLGWVMNTMTELGEEGVQGFLQELGVQLGDPEFTELDAKKLWSESKQSLLDARYAVVGLGTVGTVFDFVEFNREVKQVEARTKAMTSAGYSEEEAKNYAVAEARGFVTKKAKLNALIAVDASSLVNRGVTKDLKMAENLARDYNTAKTDEAKKEARINMQVQKLITEAEKLHGKLSTADALEINLDEARAVAIKIDNSNDEVATNIAQAFLNRYKISIVANSLEKNGVPKQSAIVAAQQLDTATTQEEVAAVFNKLQEDFNVIKMTQGEDFIYGKLGAITKTEWKRLGKMSPEVLQAVIQQNAMDEETAIIFTRAANGEVNAQRQYNKHLDAKRQEAYKVFINENKLDTFVNTDVELKQQELPEIHKQQIRAGVHDNKVRRFIRKYDLKDLSIEEARLKYEAAIKRRYEMQDRKKQEEDVYENTDRERKRSLRKIRTNILNSLSEIRPDVDIVLHRSRKAFAKATGDANANGYYIDETGKIHIDESTASVGIIAHEAFHSLAYSALGSGDFEIQAKDVFRQVLPNLKPSIRKEVEAYINSNEELNWEGYEGTDYYYEEGLAKTLELLALEYNNLNPENKSAIRKLIESVIEFLGLGDYSEQIFDFGVEFDVNKLSRRELQYRAKLLGIKGRNVSTEELRNKIGNQVSQQELQVISAMQTMASKMMEGVALKDRDVDFIRPDFENQTRNQVAKRAKALGLKATGSKKELIKRIRESYPNLRASKNYLNDPKFLEDFEGTAVVDDEGLPLMVQHGTSYAFDDADLDTRNGMIFFTDNSSVAQAFSNGRKPRIFPAYINMKKPLRLSFEYMSGVEDTEKGKMFMINSLNIQYPDAELPDNIFELKGKEFIAAIKATGIDGFISPHIAMFGEAQQFVVFDMKNVVPAFTHPTYGRTRAAKRMPRSESDIALERYADDIYDLESDFDIDLDLPAPLVSNRVEREERAMRDFDLLAAELPDDITYEVRYINGEAVVYMDIANDRDIDDVKEVADKTHVKIITSKMYDGFIEMDGAFEYRPVRGRHIETLKIAELRSLAKEMGVSTAGIDLPFLEKMETMFRRGGKISPVTYQKSLTADVTNEEIVQETDLAALRPQERAAVQREGVVPEVGRENYRSTVARNRLKFLETRQELIDRLRPEVGEFMPRKVKGRRASKDRTPAEIDSIIDQLIEDMERDTKDLLDQRKRKKMTKDDMRSKTKKRFRGKVAEKIKILANLHDVVLRDIVKVEEYTGRTRNIQQFRVGKRTNDNAVINAIVVGNKIYYFASRKQVYQGAEQTIFYRVDENGVELMPTGESITIGALIDQDTRIEQTMIGYTAEDAARSMYLQSLETYGKRPQKGEKFRNPNREKQRELAQDDFGLARLTRAELIELGKDDRLDSFKGLGKRLGVIKKTDDILADMSDEEIARIVKRNLNALRKEAVKYQEEREVYRNTLREDLEIDPDSAKGRSLSFEEMRSLHEARALEEQEEYDETEFGDEDDFREFMEAMKDEKEQRLEEGTKQGALTKKQIERTQKAFGDAEPDKFERQKFDTILFQASTEYISSDIDGTATQIIADSGVGAVTGLTVKQLTGLKLRIIELEDIIENLSEEISDEYDMVGTGGGSNYGNIIKKQQELRRAQDQLLDVTKAARIASNQWGKQGVALRMSRTERNEYRLGEYINLATKNFNMNKNGEAEEALPEEVLKEVTNQINELRRVDKELDKVTGRRRDAEEVWDKDEAVKVIYDKTIKGGRWVAVALEKYIPKSEIGRLKNEEERLESLYQGILQKIKSFGYEVATTFSANNGHRASKSRQELAEFHDTIMDLMKYHVYNNKVKTLEELVPLLQVDVPALSEIEIIRVISNRSKKAQKQLTTEEQETMKKLKTLARLQDDIDLALKGLRRPRPDRKPQDDEIKSARILLRQYEALIMDTTRDDELAQQIFEQIERIDQGIENVINPRIPQRQKSEQLKKAEAALRDIRKRKNVEAELELIESIINESDRERAIGRWEAVYGVLKKKEKTPQSAELKELLTKRNKRAKELNEYINNLKLRDANWWAKAKVYGLEIAGMPRQLMASGDMSYFMRQGLLAIFMNPKVAGQAYIEAFKAFSETNAALIDVSMRSHPRYAEMEQYGLDLTRYDGRMTDNEEVFANNLLNKRLMLGNVDINAFGYVTRASERHMVTGLNFLRFTLMDNFLQSETGINASKEGKIAFANYINTMTGRAKIAGGKLDKVMGDLGQIFFSPRFAYSRVVLPYQTIKTVIQHPELRKILLTQWASMATTGLMILGLAYLSADEDERDELYENYFNVYSPDFGLIPIGDARYDIFGGQMQPFRFFARLLAESINTGFDGEKKYWDDDISVIRETWKFVTSKSSPQLAIAYEAIFKEDIRYGGKIDFTDPQVLKDFLNISPLALQGLAEVAGEVIDEEMSVGLAAATFAAEIHGVGVNIWNDDDRRSKSNKSKWRNFKY